MGLKNQKHIYCECKFLETCISIIENWKTSNIGYKELELWMCLKSMIFSSDIVLHLDISKDDYIAIVNKKKTELIGLEKQLQVLESQRQKGITHLILTERFVTPNSIEPSDSKQLTSYYLSCLDDETCKKCMNEFGVIVINPENLEEFEGVLKDNGFATRKGDQKGWGLLPKGFPCNSLIMIDNYIISDLDLGKENLKGLLGRILPEKLNLDVPFQVTIISPLKKNNNKEDVDSNACYIETANLIGELRPDLYFKLGIFKCSSGKFHDRTIITNNTYISCAGGFDLIKDGKPDKTTTVNYIFPFFCNSIKWVSKAYSNVISEATDVFNNATALDKQKKEEFQRGFFVGKRENRLIGGVV